MAINEKQIKALTYLSTGMKAADVAKKIGVNEATLSLWNRESDFRIARNRLRSAAIEAARDNVRWLSAQATEALRDSLDKSQPPAIRLRAAIQIIELALQDADKVGGYTVQELGYDDDYESLRKYPPTIS